MQPEFSPSDLKNYPHFDAPMSVSEINSLVGCPIRVASHKFYPFLLYFDEWQPYRTSPKKSKPKKKSRPVRYAARKDAYIFSYYRQILLEKYETKLVQLGIEDCPVAYRKIRKVNGKGKCNIDFAKDAFDFIQETGDCTAIALDIEGYFENLDHSIIKKLWCELIEKDRLPEDHYRVFKNITDYRYVDQQEVYRRLGFLKADEKGIERYEVPYDKMPKQLCSPKDFRDKICGYDGKHSNIVKSNEDEKGNPADYGIPQGAPLSDLIANFYLIYFDLKMKEYADSLDGMYMRYSDDILLIIPNDKLSLDSAINYVDDAVSGCGKKIKIKKCKTCIVEFKRAGDKLVYQHKHGSQRANGFEYLGFRYDGKKIYVRNSTISRLYRKLSSSVHGAANFIVADNPDLDVDDYMNKFNPAIISQQYMQVKSEILQGNDYSTWTFYSYLIRASKIFGAQGNKIVPQARNFKRVLHVKMRSALENRISKEDRT